MNKVKFLKWLARWFGAWMDIVCGLIAIITFCTYRPEWDLAIRSYFIRLSYKII